MSPRLKTTPALFLLFFGTICICVCSSTKSSLSWKLLKNKASQKEGFVKLDKALWGDTSSTPNETETTDTKTASTEQQQVRQYGHGWGWSPSYSSGGYDVYTLLAVSAFAALLGALFFELATGGSLRSLGSSFTLPFGLSVNTNQISEVMSRVAEIVSDLDWDEIMNKAESAGVKSRVLRETNAKTGLLQWVKAYKKDPVQYQCIRKVACQTLADSSLVAKSIKSPFGGVVLSTVGYFIENGDKLQSIVKDTVGNPEKCRDMAPFGFCDDELDDELNSEEADSST